MFSTYFYIIIRYREVVERELSFFKAERDITINILCLLYTSDAADD